MKTKTKVLIVIVVTILLGFVAQLAFTPMNNSMALAQLQDSNVSYIGYSLWQKAVDVGWLVWFFIVLAMFKREINNLNNKFKGEK